MNNELFSLTGRRALITGGSRGIGSVIARSLAEAGARPFIVCRNREQGEQALKVILDGLPQTGEVLPCDLSSRRETERLVSTLNGSQYEIDILVHCAGSNVAEPVGGIRNESWDNVFELNLNSAMVLVRGLSPNMSKAGWGRIVLMSSIMGMASREDRGTYSATKAGLIGFMKSAALELGPSGVTVNCIAPGPIETELTASLVQSETGKEYASRLALRRWGRPEELIGPALLLCTEAGSFITGSVLVADGGALARAI